MSLRGIGGPEGGGAGGGGVAGGAGSPRRGVTVAALGRMVVLGVSEEEYAAVGG